MTMRRMYGRHYHALCTLAPMINRLRCLRSTNTEQEERFFNTLKSITNQTSNMRPEHIISNGFLRLQAEQQINATHRSLAQQGSYISSLASKLEQVPNSFIPLSRRAERASNLTFSKCLHLVDLNNPRILMTHDKMAVTANIRE